MLETFYPSEDIKSAYDIKYERYYNMGYRAIIYDIDNTLVCHGAPANEEAKKLFLKLRKIGFKTLVLSNNKEPRVKSFADSVGCQYIYKANKPAKSGYLKAMNLMGSDIYNTLFIGDQLFTDVWGANRVGLHSILTSPINPKEEIQIVIKRFFEKIILRSYYKRKELLGMDDFNK